MSPSVSRLRNAFINVPFSLGGSFETFRDFPAFFVVFPTGIMITVTMTWSLVVDSRCAFVNLFIHFFFNIFSLEWWFRFYFTV